MTKLNKLASFEKSIKKRKISKKKLEMKRWKNAKSNSIKRNESLPCSSKEIQNNNNKVELYLGNDREDLQTNSDTDSDTDHDQDTEDETYLMLESSEDEEDETEYYKEFKSNLYKPLYAGSRLNLDEFIFAFLKICMLLNISKAHKAILFDFIKNILPSDSMINNLSYYKIKNRFLKNNIYRLLTICKTCTSHVDSKTKKCLNKNCSSNTNYYDAIVFDIRKQLSEIIKKNKYAIDKYKGNIRY